MDRLIYLDNAATTKTAPEVVKEMLPYFSEFYGNPSSIYDFAGKIRDKNISKGGFVFANCAYFDEIFQRIEAMPDSEVDEILDKYIEMNIAHPFMEGNGRATRIWLDVLLKDRIHKCVNWQLIDKKEYLSAMEKSPIDPSKTKSLIIGALTEQINDRDIYLKGIDYSYYYEEID